MIGEVRIKIVNKTKRCTATSANPSTDERDMNIPLKLKDAFDYGELGVYAEVLQGGTIKPGDEIAIAA